MRKLKVEKLMAIPAKKEEYDNKKMNGEELESSAKVTQSREE